jgi:hypothetical protein
VSRGKIGLALWITLKSHEPPGPASAPSLRWPILPEVLPWPTRGRPCEIIGPKPFARPSSLLVDPGISVPHNHLPASSRIGLETRRKGRRKWSTTRPILRRPPPSDPTPRPSLLSAKSARSLVRSPYAIPAFQSVLLYFPSH